jgi:hypothetical protein
MDGSKRQKKGNRMDVNIDHGPDESMKDMPLGQSERWITPSEWENNIGHDGRFGDDENYHGDICLKPRLRAGRKGKYVPAMQER